MKALLFIAITFCTGYLITAQSIDKFSIDSGGASTSVGGIEILYTIGEVAIQEVETPTLSISEGFINSSFKVQIDPKVFLQGPILNPDNDGLMNDDLRQSDLIPTTSPYADSATCVASVFTTTGNDAIVDWVWVELRASNDNSKLLNGKSALLQRDGDIVATDGSSTLTMNVPPKDHYIVVKHRNHLGAMSNIPIFLSENTSTTLDFTDSAFNTFGSNAQVVMVSGNTALWAGDTNGNETVLFSGTNNDANTIKDYILADPSNFLDLITFSSTGFLLEDVNLDGVSRFSGSFNDSNLIKDNVLDHPDNFFSLATFMIPTTVPPINN